MCTEISEDKFERVKRVINKLLQVTMENGASENEAITATLKVQEILAKYDMELSEITDSTAEKIMNYECETSNDVWKDDLARVIANNFCVEVYKAGKTKIVFYGYKRHCETAKEVFTTMYNYGRKRGAEVFKEYREVGRNVKGIKNQYYIGFVQGIKSALDTQSRSLMVITPPEVIDSFRDFCISKNMGSKQSTMKYRENTDIYDRGVADGRSMASRKELVG